MNTFPFAAKAQLESGASQQRITALSTLHLHHPRLYESTHSTIFSHLMRHDGERAGIELLAKYTRNEHRAVMLSHLCIISCYLGKLPTQTLNQQFGHTNFSERARHCFGTACQTLRHITEWNRDTQRKTLTLSTVPANSIYIERARAYRKVVFTASALQVISPVQAQQLLHAISHNKVSRRAAIELEQRVVQRLKAFKHLSPEEVLLALTPRYLPRRPFI